MLRARRASNGFDAVAIFTADSAGAFGGRSMPHARKGCGGIWQEELPMWLSSLPLDAR
jgi:hypothetical protein